MTFDWLEGLSREQPYNIKNKLIDELFINILDNT